jgi:hypothetical protein
MKDVQTTGEACSPQNRTSGTSKHEIYQLFPTLLLSVFLALLDPDPDPKSGSTDLIESGSNPNPDPKHYLYHGCHGFFHLWIIKVLTMFFLCLGKCLYLSGLIPRPMNADNDRELLGDKFLHLIVLL